MQNLSEAGTIKTGDVEASTANEIDDIAGPENTVTMEISKSTGTMETLDKDNTGVVENDCAAGTVT